MYTHFFSALTPTHSFALSNPLAFIFFATCKEVIIRFASFPVNK